MISSFMLKLIICMLTMCKYGHTIKARFVGIKGMRLPLFSQTRIHKSRCISVVASGSEDMTTSEASTVENS